jgi:hypothetical protein
MYRHEYTWYRHCTNMYVQNNTCLDLVHRIHIPGTYMECTSSRLYVHSKKQKAKSCLYRVLNPRPLAQNQEALTAMPAASLNLRHSYSICLLLYLQDVRRGTRCATRAGHDVAGMDLLGHLDSQGPDSEVLPGPVARTRTSLWY